MDPIILKQMQAMFEFGKKMAAEQSANQDHDCESGPDDGCEICSNSPLNHSVDCVCDKCDEDQILQEVDNEDELPF